MENIFNLPPEEHFQPTDAGENTDYRVPTSEAGDNIEY